MTATTWNELLKWTKEVCSKACVDLIIITPSVFFIQLNSLGTKKSTFWWYVDRKKILTIKKFILVSFGTRRFQRNFQLRWTNLVLPIDFLICLHQSFNLVKKFIFNSVMIDLTDLLELLQYRKLGHSCLQIPKSSRKLPTFSMNYYLDKKNNALFWVRKENFDNSLDDKKIGKVIFSSFLYNYYTSTYINASIWCCTHPPNMKWVVSSSDKLTGRPLGHAF